MVGSCYKYSFIRASHILFKALDAYISNGTGIKMEVANFCAAMDTLIDQDGIQCNSAVLIFCNLSIFH